MAKLDYRSDEKQDERLDPYSENARDLYHQEQDAYDREFNDIAQNYDQTADNAQEDANVEKTKNIEKTKEKEQDAGWETNVSKGGGGKKQPVNVWQQAKKKGPLGLIAALLLGGGGGLTLLFSPGALIVDLKEKMIDKFNDQLAAMDVRTTAMIKKKLKGTTSGVCTKVVNIRCKFNSLKDSDDPKKSMVKKLEKNGIKVNSTDKTLIRGRVKPDSFEFQGKVIKAEDFARELRTNPAFRSAMFKAYNPKLAGFADSTFARLAQKLGISKQKNIDGEDEKERRKSVLDSASGDKIAEQSAGVRSEEQDCDGGDDCKDGKRTVYKDEAGNTIDKDEYDRRIGESSSLNAEFKARKELTETGSKIAKGTLKGALTVTALGLGAVDSACTGYQLIRTVGFAAKYLGMVQLLRYAHVFMNTADSIKAGDATPEQVEYAGKILTTPNVEGKTATDSYGYKYAVYNDINGMPRPEDVQAESKDEHGNNIELSEEEKQKILVADETTKYINGQLVSKNILAKFIDAVGDSGSADTLDDVCGFVKSGWGQAIVIGAAVVGAVVAFFTGGASVGWGTAAQVAVSVAISVAMAMLTPKLIDMAAGTLIGNDELTNGNRTGNAITSGMGGYNAQTAQARGLAALKRDDAPAYVALTNDTLAQYAELDRYEHSPFDPTNRHTFVGALVSQFMPYATGFSSVSGALSSITSMTTASFSSLFPSVTAADPTAEYKVCQDMDYQELELAVDPFCNPRYGLSSGALSLDSDKVLDYMINNDYIDEETGEPKSGDNDYAKYIENCMERAVSIGGYTEDNPSKGEECINKNNDGAEEEKYNMFRVYYIDYTINDGMENGYEGSGSSASQAAPGAWVHPAGDAKYSVGPQQDFGPRDRGHHDGIDMAYDGDFFAACSGKILSIGRHGNNSGSAPTNIITIDCGDGITTKYMHYWTRDIAPGITEGKEVQAGDKLAKVGNQGHSFGAHLHYQVEQDGKPIDPVVFMKKVGVDI